MQFFTKISTKGSKGYYNVNWNMTPLTTPSKYFEKIKQSVVSVSMTSMTSSVVCSECEHLKTEVQSLKMIIRNRERAFKEVSSSKILL